MIKIKLTKKYSWQKTLWRSRISLNKYYFCRISILIRKKTVKEHLKNYPNMPKTSYSLTSICRLWMNLQVLRKLEIMKILRCVPFLSLPSRATQKKYSKSQYIDKDINEVLYKSLNYDHMVLMINKYI